MRGRYPSVIYVQATHKTTHNNQLFSFNNLSYLSWAIRLLFIESTPHKRKNILSWKPSNEKGVFFPHLLYLLYCPIKKGTSVTDSSIRGTYSSIKATYPRLCFYIDQLALSLDDSEWGIYSPISLFTFHIHANEQPSTSPRWLLTLTSPFFLQGKEAIGVWV